MTTDESIPDGSNTESGEAGAGFFSIVDDAHQRAKAARDLGERTIPLAEQVTGTPIGAGLIAGDVIAEMMDKGTSSLFELLERLGRTASEYVYTPENGAEITHELVNVFTLRKGQRRAIAEILNTAIDHAETTYNEKMDAGRISMLEGSSIATKLINGSMSLVRILQAVEATDGDSKLFAQLYTPVGYRYSTERAADPTYIARFDDMELGQQIGAIYRFFTSTVAWSPDGIRTRLKQLVIQAMTKRAG